MSTRPSAARIFLVAALLMSWIETWLMISPWHELRHPVGLARVLPMAAFLTPVGIGALWVAHGALALAFLLRWREQVVGWTLVALLGVQVTLEMSTRDIFMPHLGAFIAGDVLIAWLLGRIVARRQGLTGAEADAWAQEVTLGTLGAMLTLSAVSKLAHSGLGWVDGAHHCATIYEHGITKSGPLMSLRLAIADREPLCTAGASYVLAAEFSSFLLCWPRWRHLQAWAIVLVFLTLGVTTGIHEYMWPAMAVVLVRSSLGERPTPV